MADDTTRADPAAPSTPRPPHRGSWRRFFVQLLLLALVVAGLGAVVLDSPLGHRVVADQIATIRPSNGLTIRIGRIEGSLFGKAEVSELVLGDPKGRFLTVPEATLDWRPLTWVRGGGLDIRLLELRRATLLRLPALRPGDPNQPILPDFDIRIDRFAARGLTLAPGVIGERRRLDFTGRADIRGGRAIVSLDGRVGGKDRLMARLDSEPDRDKFDLALDYQAPRDGLLAAITGVRHDVTARVSGKGRFADWRGTAAATSDAHAIADLRIDHHGGRFTIDGTLRPEPVAPAALARALGPQLAVRYDGLFQAGTLDGAFALHGSTFRADAKGQVDLTKNAAHGLAIEAQVPRGDPFVSAPDLQQARISARLDGPFTDLAIAHVVTLDRFRTDGFAAQGLRTAGTAHWDGKVLRLPLALSAAQARTGKAELDQRLVGARITGDLALSAKAINSDNLVVTLKNADARLVLRGDIANGAYALAGKARAQRIPVPSVGEVDALAGVLFKVGKAVPWALQANVSAALPHPTNATIANLAGGWLKARAGLVIGQKLPLQIKRGVLNGPKFDMAFDARMNAQGTSTLTGKGRQSDYGPFSVEGTIASDGPHAALVFADPLPAAGVRDLKVTLEPEGDGFVITAKGDSRLGPLDGLLGLVIPKDGPTRIDVRRFAVFQTETTGALVLGEGGASGKLTVAGGGLNGDVTLAPRDGGQSVLANIDAHNAKFGGDNPIAIGQAKVTVDAQFGNGNSTIQAGVQAQGLSLGRLFIGRLRADATIVNGSGSVTASLAGRRGTRFALQGTAAFQPDKIVAFVAGDYAGQGISMPRRMVLERDGTGDGAGGKGAAADLGWKLNPTQINFGSGAVIASGHVLGGPTQVDLQVSRMPLSVVDIVLPDLGLGGLASGLISYRNDNTGAPSGRAALQVKGLTRSGLVLSSRPLDISLVAALDATRLQARAVAREGSATRGRLQMIVSDLPRGGNVLSRLRGGQLRAQLRYGGPADALWRLSGVEVFDLTGPLGAAADITGTIDNPVISGALATKALRVQSSLTGSDIRDIEAVGSFHDSRLALQRFAGTTPGGGKVSGSGTIDLSDIATNGVALDLRLAATHAQLINRPEMAATVTGPLRVVSTGIGGTIAGRVHIDGARWTLGRAGAALDLPTIATTEINGRADIAPPRARNTPWRFLIDAAGANRIDVRGLGLDSEWGADVRLRGDTANPQIFGQATVVRGGYEFAGKRFELTRGRIRFTGEVPIDPQVDIGATGDANGYTATISILGSAQKPAITFSSVPALPEEEVLSRMLFGSSITQISAPEAVQLAAALASLRGGGGLDPINKLRNAIGLDRLRIVSPDATTGQGTAIAVGKYLGRRIFVELVTDGRGYSATSVEFRITRWLALLGTLSTIGDEQINLKASKDY
ncbi:translocation/assembly module TamB domain-containing protein [Novosphingobium sp. FKTRR1]|uniref:translocation/assembly module TamB domain-containing protein n=1 Tax=Novosphingobium sp. FKTRR1 TaxID=2879118 RepID=UPI001CF062F0|nr:translocation/assembly module TamB domain-containing protein [Novosphingobium sp. FKTRR1]